MATPKLATTFVVLLLTGLLSGPRGVDAGCPAGWRQNGSFCYRLFNEQRTWGAAENRCKTFRPLNSARCPDAAAHLVSIHSESEKNFVYNYFRSQSGVQSNTKMWIGLNDIQREGTMVWSDGTQFNFRAWLPGEPNNSGNEDCVEIGHKACSPAKWNDLACSNKSIRHFMCKMRA
ncbi:echinoidin-like [Diadema antillarum]|uniref:echinoidin-like n=1 Tax=Diadema antillarum TaxID=105358 RepID=UPI003A888E37